MFVSSLEDKPDDYVGKKMYMTSCFIFWLIKFKSRFLLCFTKIFQIFDMLKSKCLEFLIA